jgi:hypothetical protein
LGLGLNLGVECISGRADRVKQQEYREYSRDEAQAPDSVVKAYHKSEDSRDENTHSRLRPLPVVDISAPPSLILQRLLTVRYLSL